jgi:Cu-Zn family superoxide dismutase
MPPFELKQARCILYNSDHQEGGVVLFQELSIGGPVEIRILLDSRDLSPGLHGIHIHRSGNLSQEPTSLCDHYNPFGKDHGDLNEKNSHAGDLGNVYVDAEGKSDETLLALQVRLRGWTSVLGRSVVVHSGVDDLGRGDYPDSKKSGHSGSRVLWGIIAVDESCS